MLTDMVNDVAYSDRTNPMTHLTQAQADTFEIHGVTFRSFASSATGARPRRSTTSTDGPAPTSVGGPAS